MICISKENYLAVNRSDKIDFNKAVVIYLLGGLVGTVWETLLNLCSGDGFVFCNGSIFTPFNFVYGVGALFIIACMHNLTKVWQVYLIGCFGGGFVEYILNFLEEKILGTHSWDYSDKLLNINGRTTLLYMAVWGLLCVAVIFLVYRPLVNFVNSLPTRTVRIVAVVALIVIVLDLTVTVGAMLRYVGRNTGKEAISQVGMFIDRVFDDEFMQLRFPKMRFV